MALRTSHDGRTCLLSPADAATSHVAQVLAGYGVRYIPAPCLLSINGLPVAWKGRRLEKACHLTPETLDIHERPLTEAPEASVPQETFRETVLLRPGAHAPLSPC